MNEWLIVLGAVSVCILLIMSFFRHLEARVDKADVTQKHDSDRISSLEVKDYAQDARLDYHRKHLIQVKKDVKQLGKDVGWDDSGHSTQVMDTKVMTTLANQTKKPPDDEPPPNAA